MEAPSSAQPPNKEPNETMSIVLHATEAGRPIDQHPTRRIVLTKEKPSISIGRASKVTSKGFVATESNVYFDSPVMSRHHADLTADFEKKCITIKDSGSLHGTYYTANDGLSREIKVAPGDAIKLTDKDTVRFGIDIFRSDLTFPPTKVTVEISEEPTKSVSREPSTNRFTVPDDVDSEDQMSDDESVVEAAPPIQAVDLTVDVEADAVIDLTFDPEQTLNVQDSSLITTGSDGSTDDPADDTSSAASDMSIAGDDLMDESDCSDMEDNGSADCSEDEDQSDAASICEEPNSPEKCEIGDSQEATESTSQEAQPTQRDTSPSDFIFQSNNDGAPACDAPKTMPEISQVHEVNLEPADASEDSAWASSGVGFINDPDSVPLMPPESGAEALEPDLDETSAFAYEQSKAEQTVRRLLISDLLSQEPLSAAGNQSSETKLVSDRTSIKRAHDTAFPAEEEDDNQAIIIDQTTIASLVRSREIKSPKRRRFVEVAACLALGGAGMLSALIYTAPSFA